jgi:hypothetical protein
VERKKLDHVNRQIAQAKNDIRSLQTEFSTRANLAQLERWNGDVLALTAPTAAQYMATGQQLASLGGAPADGAQVQMASLVIPTLPVISTPAEDDAPVADPEPARPSAPVVMASAKPAPTPARVEVASAKPAADPLAAIVKAAAAHPAHPSSASRAKAEAVAMLDRKLLSDSTLGDLMSRARAETASLR